MKEKVTRQWIAAAATSLYDSLDDDSKQPLLPPFVDLL
jgi:hypothetical protein